MERTERLKELRRKFIWRSYDGRVWTIHSMTSEHMLNVMKMLFNELAEALGLDTVSKTPDGLRSSIMNHKRKVEIVVMLLDELEQREDLPKYMRHDYTRIRAEVLFLCGAQVRLRMENGSILAIEGEKDAAAFFRDLDGGQ